MCLVSQRSGPILTRVHLGQKFIPSLYSTCMLGRVKGSLLRRRGFSQCCRRSRRHRRHRVIWAVRLLQAVPDRGDCQHHTKNSYESNDRRFIRNQRELRVAPRRVTGLDLVRCMQDFVHGANQPVHVRMEIPPCVHLGCITVGKQLQTFWELCWSRHVGAVDEDGNDRHVSPQCGLDFYSYGVTGVRNSGMPAPIPAKPFRPNYDNENVSLFQCLINVLPKIDPERDVVDIHENRIFAEVHYKAIKNAPRHGGCIRAAIRNYYPWHGLLRREAKTLI